jgi:hypothetical protein
MKGGREVKEGRREGRKKGRQEGKKPETRGSDPIFPRKCARC